ncbi:hypothetical protein C0J52_18260 [Blattella germanica]|nr:hypothetical protein C0J52_18260 [Blattella germanica]
MEVNVEQPKKKEQKLNDAPVADYRFIEVPPATVQIVPKVEEVEEISNQSVAGDKVNAAVTTSFVIGEDSSVKQHSTSKVIRLCGRRSKVAVGSDTDGSCADSSDKRFSCFICSKSFKYNGNLKRHINAHTGERIYRCDLCEKTFLDASTLSRHRKSHSGDKPWSCKICKKSFRFSSSLRSHITVHNQEERPYQCETCLKRFLYNSSYRAHKFIHTGQKPHVCDTCGTAFVNISKLNEHRKIHLEVKPYNCERCGKEFANSSNYARHLLIHEGDKYFTCSICGGKYNYKSSLTRHMRTHIQRGNEIATKDIAETNSKSAVTEDHANTDSVEEDDLNDIESAYEESKKSIILKDFNKIKPLPELKTSLPACKTEDVAIKLEIPPACKTEDVAIKLDIPPACKTEDDAIKLEIPPACKTEDVAIKLEIPPACEDSSVKQHSTSKVIRLRGRRRKVAVGSDTDGSCADSSDKRCNSKSSLTRHMRTHMQRGNEIATKDIAETNSKSVVTDDHANTDSVEEDDLNVIESAYEESKKSIILKDFNKIKPLPELKSSLPSCKTEDDAKKLEIPPGMPELDPSYDHTLLLPQDKTIAEQTTTEDNFSILTSSADFRSTEDIPARFIPPSLPVSFEATSSTQENFLFTPRSGDIPPGMPEFHLHDPTILLPQDKTIAKQTTTEDAFTILIAAEDFGSTEEIPTPFLPPSLPTSFDATSSTQENFLFTPSSGERAVSSTSSGIPIMEVNVEHPKKKEQKLNDAPVAVYRCIEVLPAAVQIVPKVEEVEEISNQNVAGDKVNATVTTSFVIGEDSSVKQHSTSKVIRLRGRRHKVADRSDTDGSCADSTDKKFSCFICSKSFKYNSNLKRHINTHTGERNYKCDLCEKTFLDASTLSRHR